MISVYRLSVRESMRLLYFGRKVLYALKKWHFMTLKASENNASEFLKCLALMKNFFLIPSKYYVQNVLKASTLTLTEDCSRRNIKKIADIKTPFTN